MGSAERDDPVTTVFVSTNWKRKDWLHLESGWGKRE